MADRGNITYHLFEGEYDDGELDYKVESQIIMDYYSDLGYYIGFNHDFWNYFFRFMSFKVIKKDNLLKNGINSAIILQHIGRQYTGFSNRDELRSCITKFSRSFDKKEDSTNVRTFFNKVNIDSSSLFNDFIELFFNKQNKKVKKSFLHTKDIDSFDKNLGYDYWNVLKTIFGNRFTKFVNNELEKRGINEKFSTIDNIDSLFLNFQMISYYL